MKLTLNYDNLRKLAFHGPMTKYLYLYRQEEEYGKLYIQKPELFSINLLSNFERMKNDEFNEIRYLTSKKELVSIIKINDDEYILNIDSNEKNSKELLSKILG